MHTAGAYFRGIVWDHPVIEQRPNGRSFVGLTLGTTHTVRRPGKSEDERTYTHSIECWDDIAEREAQNLKVGDFVDVECFITTTHIATKREVRFKARAIRVLKNAAT